MSNKEPLKFEIHSKLDVVTQLKELFTWRDFEIMLPVSKLRNVDPQLVDKLFTPFSIEKELLELSKKEDGELIKLNDKQIAEIRKTGKFSVKSNLFSSSYHVWSLSKCLYFGSENVQSFYECVLALSLEQLYLCLDKIIDTHSISVFTSLKLIIENLLEIPKLLIGIKEMKPRYSDRQMHSLSAQYFDKFVIRDLQEIRKNLFSDLENKSEIDLRLGSFLKEPEVLQLLQKIERKQKRKWARDRVSFRYENQQQAIFKDLVKYQGLEKAWEGLIDIENKEGNKRLIEKITMDSELAKINIVIGKLVGSHLKALEIINTIRNKYLHLEENYRNQVIREIEEDHKIKRLFPRWKEERIKKKLDQFAHKKKEDLFEEILTLFKENGLTQEHYLLSRYVEYQKKTELDYIHKLSLLQSPSISEKWSKIIWSSDNWIFTPYYSDMKTGKMDYKVEKSVTMKSESNTYGWRIFSIFQDMSVSFNNTFYYLFRNIIYGKYGFKSLLFPRPFHPEYKISSQGKLECDAQVEVETFLSMIKAIWINVKNCRREFEKQPEGFIATSVSRGLNIFWNYFFKGISPTVALSVSFPIFSLSYQFFNVALAVASLFVIPCLSVLKYLFGIVVYDSAKNEPLPLFQILLKILLQGGLQLLYSVASLFIHPIKAILILIAGCFLVNRVKGPGVTENIYYQIPHQLALLFIQEYMERIELTAFRNHLLVTIDEPKTQFENLDKELFEDFGLTMNSKGSSQFEAIVKSCDHFKKILNDKVIERKQKERFLNSLLQHNLKERIILSEQDLKKTIILGKQLIELFFESIKKYKTEEQLHAFWDERNLAKNDWEGITRGILLEILGEHALTPIEEMEDKYVINVNHESIQEVCDSLLLNTNIKDDQYIDKFYSPLKVKLTNSVCINDVMCTQGNIFYSLRS